MGQIVPAFQRTHFLLSKRSVSNLAAMGRRQLGQDQDQNQGSNLQDQDQGTRSQESRQYLKDQDQHNTVTYNVQDK